MRIKYHEDIIISPADIGNVSIRRDEIRLPFKGKLPIGYESASFFLRVAPDDVRATITAVQGGKKTHYIVEADQEEILTILEPFFYRETKPRVFTTRLDCGLTRYWLGSYQRDFNLWRTYTGQPMRLVEVVQQLTPERRKKFYSELQQMEDWEKQSEAGSQ